MPRPKPKDELVHVDPKTIIHLHSSEGHHFCLTVLDNQIHVYKPDGTQFYVTRGDGGGGIVSQTNGILID